MLQYELMLSLARDVERFCPRAWLIQIGNPLFEGCTLMTRQTGAKVIGLCHPFAPRRLCQILGLPPDEVQWQAVGVNKSVYLTRLRRDGRNLYPAIDEWIETQAPAYWRTFRGGFGESVLSRAAVDHYRRVGLMPLADASRTSHEWYYHTDLATKREWYGHLGGFDSEIGWSMYLERLAGDVAERRGSPSTSRRASPT